MNSEQAGHGAGDSAVDRRIVLLVAATASFLTPFMASSVNIALPSIGREFSIDAVALSWVTTAYLLAAAVFLVPLGRIADIHGRRKVFLAGMVGYTVVSFLCTLSTSETMLIALRGLQGFTDAMMFGTSTAIVTSVHPPEQRGRALGITVAAVYSGSALGPFLGGFFSAKRKVTAVNFALSRTPLSVAVGSAKLRSSMFTIRGIWAILLKNRAIW